MVSPEKTLQNTFSFLPCVIMDLFVGYCYMVFNENMQRTGKYVHVWQ